jgi:hypothetical protein
MSTLESVPPRANDLRSNESGGGTEPTIVTCSSASHDVLFTPCDERCSVCDDELGADDEEGTEIRGRGLFVWTRGEERRYEEPHLCPRCAAAIGMSALQRWEIEEDEG